ncbi:hypothetical protein [Brevibacillus laterosporus]|uniref:hypothetical protein n=1 Tax=Brevibacillus laterosporus TaxID=1465 RepID=UPI0015E2190B|nr:hypothetical protein [Brevibacillus laterosporus]
MIICFQVIVSKDRNLGYLPIYFYYDYLHFPPPHLNNISIGNKQMDIITTITARKEILLINDIFSSTVIGSNMV